MNYRLLSIQRPALGQLGRVVLGISFLVISNAVLLAFANKLSAPVSTQKTAYRSVQIGPYTYALEVADTPERFRQGLMFRKSLAHNHGMIFPFDTPRPVAFWMKNCKIPLDFLFIRHHRVVGLISEVPPCLADPCPAYPSQGPVDAVIELRGGEAKRRRFQPGTLIKQR